MRVTSKVARAISPFIISIEMAALESIVGIVEILRTKVIEERKSYATVSEELKRSNPTVTRGLSARSVRRFCKVHNIQASSRLSDMQLDRVVRSSVARVSKIFSLFSHI